MLSIALAAMTLAFAAEPADFALKDGERVVFLGDSITYAGMYVQAVEGYLFTRFPGRRIELINLGLPSETCSGLSEPLHPYPRPTVHERLARVLERTKPHVVVACYGMNDGIYHPFSEERFAAYREGIDRLRREVEASGARLVLMTPPPFDPRPIRETLAPADAESFGYTAPFADYDSVLERYSRWLLSLRDQGASVVDARGAVIALLEKLRAEDPSISLSGDGVHMNATGHWPIAQALLEFWKAPADVGLTGPTELVSEGSGVRFRCTAGIPMPHDPRWDGRLAKAAGIGERFNRQALVMKEFAGQTVLLSEGRNPIVRVRGDKLAEGINLTDYPALTSNQRANAIWPLVVKRERLLGAAWLDAVGHKRPDTPRGRPLEEAQAESREIERQIRALAQPVILSLHGVPSDR